MTNPVKLNPDRPRTVKLCTAKGRLPRQRTRGGGERVTGEREGGKLARPLWQGQLDRTKGVRGGGPRVELKQGLCSNLRKFPSPDQPRPFFLTIDNEEKTVVGGRRSSNMACFVVSGNKEP